MIERSTDTDAANRLVGRFLQHFALVESALDDALSSLLGLKPEVSAVVMSNMTIYSKIDTFFASEKQLAAMPDGARKAKLRSAKGRISGLNDDRNIAAHCTFDGFGGGEFVRFHRVKAKGELKISDIDWSEADVEKKCCEATQLVKDIQDLISEMKPFEAFADGSDPRNIPFLHWLGIV